MESLALKCPNAGCGRKLRGVALHLVATVVVDRTCPKCRTCWRLVVTPLRQLKNGVGYMHKLAWCSKGAI